MATVILVRHGRTTANATGILAGRPAGVQLDETGRAQAVRGRRAAARSSAGGGRDAARSSAAGRPPRARSRGRRPRRPRPSTDAGITECDYGDWQGRALKDLAKEKLWATVQTQPSAATFPGGESMRAMQARAVAAVRRHDAAVEAEHGAGRGVGRGQPRRRHQVGAGRRAGHAPRPVPAHPRRPGVDLDRPLHRDPALRAGHQHPRRRPVLAGPAAPGARRTRRPRTDAVVRRRCGPGGRLGRAS